MSPHDVALADLVAADVRVVANSVDSLSGWISLLHATVGEHDAFPGDDQLQRAHVESLRTLARAEGDLACVDSWSLALIEREQPELVERPAPTRPRSVDTEPGRHRARHGAGRTTVSSWQMRSSTCSPTTPRSRSARRC